MNFSFLCIFFVLAFSGIVSSQLYTYKTSSTLEQNQTGGFALTQFPIPAIPRGLFNITVTADYTFEVCLQEGVEVLGDVYSCNSGGFFNFTRDNNSTNSKSVYSLDIEEMNSIFGGEYESAFVGDSASTTTASTTIRGGVNYYLNYRFAEGVSNNASYTLELAFLQDGCHPDSVGLSSGLCQATSKLENNSQVTGSVKKNSSYYSFPVTASDNQEFQVTLSLPPSTIAAAGASSPAVTLSVRRGAAPYSSPDGDINDGSATLTNGTSVSVTVPTPAAGLYFVQVENQDDSEFNYILQAASKGCPSGSVGPACNSSFIDLTNNDTVILMTGTGDYDYFLVNNSTLTVGVGTKKLDDLAPTLLTSIYNFPDNSTAVTTSAGNPLNYAYLHSPSPNTTYYISVWAEDGVDYYIWANNFCANNCAGSGSGVNASSNSTLHGQCNVYTGVCDCDSGYSGLFCDRSRLATIWIVLLIIGPAIILAIAIGVPVACFLRNRRRARYERV